MAGFFWKYTFNIFNKLYNKITSAAKKSNKVAKKVARCEVLDNFNSSFYEKILSKEEFFPTTKINSSIPASRANGKGILIARLLPHLEINVFMISAAKSK